MLTRHQAMADAIAKLFYPYAEVVLHELASQTICYIANNFSRRELGDESGLDELKRGLSADVIGPYAKLNWDGRQLRAISVVLRDAAGAPEGMMCINLDVSVLESMKGVLDFFLAGNRLVSQPAEFFQDDWHERINNFIHAWLQERQLSLSLLGREHKHDLVHALYFEGAFRGKNSANYIANILGMGRATVYKHLKELKEKNDDAD